MEHLKEERENEAAPGLLTASSLRDRPLPRNTADSDMGCKIICFMKYSRIQIQTYSSCHVHQAFAEHSLFTHFSRERLYQSEMLPCLPVSMMPRQFISHAAIPFLFPRNGYSAYFPRIYILLTTPVNRKLPVFIYIIKY